MLEDDTLTCLGLVRFVFHWCVSVTIATIIGQIQRLRTQSAARGFVRGGRACCRSRGGIAGVLHVERWMRRGGDGGRGQRQVYCWGRLQRQLLSYGPSFRWGYSTVGSTVFTRLG